MLKTRLWMCAAALALVAAACGGDDDGNASPSTAAATEPASETTAAATSQSADTTAATTAAATEPVSGGTLTMLHTFETRGLDPVLLSTSTGHGDAPQAFAVFDALLYEEPTKGEITYQVAESLDSTDGKVWTLTLRPDVKFSDGTPYDAEAVKFNWARVADPANKSSNASAASVIETMTVVDPVTLEITLKQIVGQFPRTVARNLNFVGSPTAIQAKGEAFATEPVGAGPFLLESWVRDSEMTFVRNPDYWNAPLPYLDGFAVRIITDETARFQTFQAGGPELVLFGTATTPLEVVRATEMGKAVAELRPSGGLFFKFNTKRPPFDDVRARRAVAQAFDWEAMNQTLWEGANETPKSLFAESSPFYDEAIQLTQYDPAAAQQGFDEYFEATGQDVAFTITGSPQIKPIAEYMQAQLSGLSHVKAEIEVIPSTELIPRLGAGDFDIGSFSVNPFDPEPDLYNHLHSGTTLNFGGYSNPEMDAALDAGRSALDEAERIDAYRTVQELEAQDVPNMWFTRQWYHAIYDEAAVQDLTVSNVSILTDRVWLGPSS